MGIDNYLMASLLLIVQIWDCLLYTSVIVRIANLIAQHGILAAVLAGLILAGILAATMYPADSQMLAAASSVSQNILQEFGHMKLTEKQSLFAARLTIICISVAVSYTHLDVYKRQPSASPLKMTAS